MSETKKGAKEVLREHFTATRIAYMAIFTALAFVVTFLEFPIFPAAPFLKLDFANVFFLIEGFIFGPVEAIVSIGIKELLCLMKSSTGGAGEIANFLMSIAYIIIPSVLYRFRKGKKSVLLSMLLACLFQIGISLLVNRFINFPVFVKDAAAEYFKELWIWVLLFNAIKSVAVSIVVFIIYKPMSKFIKSTEQKFNKKKRVSKQEN